MAEFLLQMDRWANPQPVFSSGCVKYNEPAKRRLTQDLPELRWA